MSSSTVTTNDLTKKFQKDFGEATVQKGGKLVDATRVPTGIFPLDLAIGGGFPRGAVSTIFGPESSFKTGVALCTIKQHQRRFPDKANVFIDVENALDPAWAAALGVDVSKLVVVKPSYAEQAVDMVESYLYAEDIGMVVIDSLAAMITTSEVEGSAEKASYGGSSIVVGKMVRKVTHALLEGAKAEKPRRPTVLYVNQTRQRLNVMFGNPEDMPGGNAPKFQSNIWLRLYGKNEMDTKVSQIMPVRKLVSFILRKWKVPIVAASGKFDMVTFPHNGFSPGDVDDWNTVSSYLDTFGQVTKLDKGKGYVILDQPYKTLSEFRERLRSDLDYGSEVREAIIAKVMIDSTKVLAPHWIDKDAAK